MRDFGPTFRVNLSGPIFKGQEVQHSSWTALPFKIVPIDCPETSVTKYQSMPSNIAEEQIMTLIGLLHPRRWDRQFVPKRPNYVE